ncbi:acyltransferase family protein [Caballeronia ptereochthonis]|uniref:Acyltransferase n=1 Tax=Caballeronia ptereochthonis TaxID=1777144 RepID=A0A158A6T1_9BURK|nr:acyltransferase [Caballeronia ptereochthonis]SAK53544.1 acyltransferase [Caballeronia ptereochthonis]
MQVTNSYSNGRSDAFLRWCIAVSLALLASFGYLVTSAKSTLHINIVPTADRDLLSSANDVSLTLPARIANSVVADGWARTDNTFAASAPTAGTTPSLRWRGDIFTLDYVQLNATPKSGTLDIDVDGKRTHLDLYDPFGKTFYIKLISLAPWSSIIGFDEASEAFGIFIAVIIVALLGLKWAMPRQAAAASSHGPLVSTAYFSRLDHLRFVAAALVLLYHFFHNFITNAYRSHNPLVALIADGHTGVGLFMVLSGFIFAHIGRGKEINYKRFLLARVIRIFPLYVFALVIAFSTKRWDFKPLDIVLFAIPMANFYSVQAVPYFGQLWTIGVEFQFYSIFPFLNKFTNTRGPRYLVGLLGLFILIKACYFNLYSDGRDFGYWTILGRMDQFIIGMLGAIAYNKRHRLLGNVLAFPLSALLLLGVMTVFNLQLGGYSGTAGSSVWIIWPALEASVWMLFTLTYLSWRVRIPSGLDDLLAKFGAVSFSVYVMQYVAIPQLQRYIGVVPLTSDWTLNVLITGVFIALPGVLLLSGLTYCLIERPFFAFKVRYVSQPEHAGNVRPHPAEAREAARQEVAA